MSEIRKVPVRVLRARDERPGPEDEMATARPGAPRVDDDAGVNEGAQAATVAEPPASDRPPAEPEAQVDWRDRALRLQAEMENYRRRQQRLAQDQVEAERERLLKAFLEVVDDLERALAAPSRDGGGVREGVQLTHRAALQRLKKEDVERIEARGRRFDPAWHDAVSTVPGRQVGAAPETVVQVLEPGYRRGDRLLRPARVIVAV